MTNEESDKEVSTAIRAQDPSEELVYGHCQRLFFALWSFLNPLRHDGSELCDVLVAFGEHILIISVKRVDFDPDAPNAEVQAERWRKRAIKKSLRQALGAKRYLLKQEKFEVRALGLTGKVVLENISSKRIHCISVSLGSKGWISYGLGQEGDKPEDFVHILTEESLDILLNELSTIHDFTTYLHEKEDFFARKVGAMAISSELDVLALYIMGNRKLPDWSGNDMVVVDSGHWQELEKRPEYNERLRRDRVSELWDIVVADLIKHHLGNTFVQGNADKSGMEKIIRRLAAESRFNRRVLSKALYGILDGAKVRARIIESPDGDVVYVFMCIGLDEDREAIARELQARCLVALASCQTRLKSLTAVGIATQSMSSRLRFTIAMMAWFPSWSPELQAQADKFQALGIFKNAQATRFSELEYPEDTSPPPSGPKQ